MKYTLGPPANDQNGDCRSIYGQCPLCKNMEYIGIFYGRYIDIEKLVKAAND